MDNAGRIHSIESFATMEGDGIRMAVFMNGCPLRCAYCHNPDTWDMSNGTLYEIAELVKKADRYSAYYKNGGGVTFTGGEPLMQAEYLAEALKAFKNRGYHTAVDTSGAIIPKNIDDIIENTDLFIVDLKFATDSDYKRYCKGSIYNPLELIKKIDNSGKELRIRTVILPEINDSEKDIDAYYALIKDYRVKEYKLQGYHTMGVYKYKELGLSYPLADMPIMPEDRLESLQVYLEEKMAN